jgi:uncharacterized protein (DUF433 family)
MEDGLIQSEPAIMLGKPVIAGTRITVEPIRERIGPGDSIEQILDAYPRLTEAGIREALRFFGKGA